MRLSSSGRNDTDDFFALFLIESMGDQQNRAGAYGSNLIFRSEVALGQSIGIIENEHGRFKANIVLAKVLPVFCSSHSNRITWSPPRQHKAFFLNVSIHLYVHRPDSSRAGHAHGFGRARSQTSKVPERFHTFIFV
jgi:hypothetical protein